MPKDLKIAFVKGLKAGVIFKKENMQKGLKALNGDIYIKNLSKSNFNLM